MNYISKKDPEIQVKLVADNKKYGTVDLEYISGPDKGKMITITTSTLKRWWTEDFSVESIIKIDVDRVNTPYPEPTVQKYVKVPESVIKYEAGKSRRNNDLPTYEQLTEIMKPIRITQSYMILKDDVSIARMAAAVVFRVPESYMEKFAEKGFTGEPNNDKVRPIQYKAKTIEEFESMKEVILNA